jgi:hypothetical protein
VSHPPGVSWYENGQSALSGPLLDLDRRLDAVFMAWAREENAVEHVFPVLLPAGILGRLDYFRSFPHLVTFAAALDQDPSNLRAFADGEPVDESGEVRLARLAPVRDVLTPAACYHVYPHFEGRSLDGVSRVTVRSTCFRRESTYTPLERQWSFSMREIVCLGNSKEIGEFLSRMRDRIDQAGRALKLPVVWQEATDAFFDPSRNPKAVYQKVDPVKMELVFENRLAIASTNQHRSYFGEIFGIDREGAPAHSACVAFGIERWLSAWVHTFGPHPERWPELPRA